MTWESPQKGLCTRGESKRFFRTKSIDSSSITLSDGMAVGSGSWSLSGSEGEGGDLLSNGKSLNLVRKPSDS